MQFIFLEYPALISDILGYRVEQIPQNGTIGEALGTRFPEVLGYFYTFFIIIIKF